jgi:hypothetical protein
VPPLPAPSSSNATWIAAGLLGSVAAIAAITLLCGTTPRGLLDGVLLNPLRIGVQFVITTTAFDGRWPIPVAFILGALGWLVVERAGLASRAVPTLLSAAVRIIYGAYVLYWKCPQAPGAVRRSPRVRGAICGSDPHSSRHGDAARGRRVRASLLGAAGGDRNPLGLSGRGHQQPFATFLPILILVVVTTDGFRDLAAICSPWARQPTWICARLVQVGIVAALLAVARTEG